MREKVHGISLWQSHSALWKLLYAGASANHIFSFDSVWTVWGHKHSGTVRIAMHIFKNTLLFCGGNGEWSIFCLCRLMSPDFGDLEYFKFEIQCC